MKLTIFWRLVIGYLVIFLLATAVSAYTIFQLNQLKDVTRSILTVDNPLTDREQKLSDLLFSLMRYERKFIIIKDEALYKQFLQAGDEFGKYLDEAEHMSDDEEILTMLSEVRRHYTRYHSLFVTEVQYLRSGDAYPAEKYKEEKDSAVNGMAEILKNLITYNQHSTYGKVKELDEIQAKAVKAAAAIGIIALTIGIIISVFITINITRPLSVIKKKTREISGGNFRSDLVLSSPPEIKELAQAFNLMCTKLNELDKMKSDFFSLMSHELRTPLTSIKEGTSLLLESLKGGGLSEKQKRLMTIINEECNRLINLVNSLLDLSKMEAGMMVYNFSNADISALISKIVREMEPLTETKSISVEISNADGLPSVNVDIEKMLQVLRNLIGNAVKFTPNGGLVSIAARRVLNSESVAKNEENTSPELETLASASRLGRQISKPNADFVEVRVADTGGGIPGEKIGTIFDKFRSIHRGDSGKIAGSGLGLYIVRQIINAHGGKIWVDSTIGKGSTFTFILPV